MPCMSRYFTDLCSEGRRVRLLCGSLPYWCVRHTSGSLQIAEEGFLEAPTEANVNIGEAKVSRLVIESGIAAIDQPAK